MEQEPNGSIGRTDEVLDQAQAVGHAARILGPFLYASIAHHATPLILGDHGRAHRVTRTAGRIGGDRSPRGTAELAGQVAKSQGTSFGRLPLGRYFGEDVHLLIVHLEEDRPGEDTAINGKMVRQRRVELGGGADVIRLVELGEPDARGSRSLAEVVAGEDPRRDAPNLLNERVDRVVAAAPLGLGSVQGIGVAVIVAP